VATSSENRRREEGDAEEMLLGVASRDAVHQPSRAEGDLGALYGDVNAEVHLLHLERDECGRVEAVVDVGLSMAPGSMMTTYAMGAGQRELSEDNLCLEQLLHALSEEGVLDLLLHRWWPGHPPARGGG
jgi:hypothetical protein